MERPPRGDRRMAYAALLLFALALWLGPLQEPAHEAKAFATGLCVSLALLLAALTGRAVFAVAFTSLLMGVLGLAAWLKYRYLALPLLAPDLRYLAGADLLRTLVHYPSLLTLWLSLLLTLPWVLAGFWRHDRGRPFGRAPLRAAVALLGMLGLQQALSPTGPFASVHAKDPYDLMQERSPFASFAISFRAMQPRPPSYAPDAAGAFTWTQPPGQPPARRPLPDLVVVLEESTFDPRTLGFCSEPVCERRMFQPDARTVSEGLLNVHTWGGGTWTSEFTFLTGLVHSSLGPAGIYAPFNLAPRIRFSLPRALEAQGYRTVAVYPTPASYLNAAQAYAAYGFDASYDGEASGLSWTSTDAEIVRAFARIAAQERAHGGGRPLFLYLLTIRQHGPHGEAHGDRPPPYAHALERSPLDARQQRALADYLSRLEDSDRALSELESVLERSGRPTLLLHFGDHQPSFGGALEGLSLPPHEGVPDARRATYYHLRALHWPVQGLRYPALDLALLGGLLLDAAGLAKDPFFTANALLRERCQGQYLACEAPRLVDSYHTRVFAELGDLQ
ncbi:sulfatase-like hydrolase/transferase [Aggregicoccus sp. 17bor-14]|uniref:sulfatase-like hydrolase/transferase n=1 Tax=Myxococcaceae TaxID=31 RepID=UPI00129C8528|nr:MULTISPECIES: sulfatase-like hydrolase/transferase [Myxococcaceae]MBF5044691.1 sulfatase-like hydrolase/transferase [Simulacricoccus sp. 17bor-14]MRI90435.1 sulfatase-like hydrolase/transferase [Aggregicoccus sp. 17bor-14]